MVIVSATDSGAGMTQDMVPRLFKVVVTYENWALVEIVNSGKSEFHVGKIEPRLFSW